MRYRRIYQETPPRVEGIRTSLCAIVQVSGEETDGRFSLVYEVQAPGFWTPLHVHRRDGQAHYVLEGEATFYLPGESVAVGPGECGYGPINVPHTEQVTSSEPLRQLVVNSPAGASRRKG